MGFRDSGRGGGFNRERSGGSRFGGGGFGGRGGFNRNREDRGPREMFNATCSKCGKECQVPFRPTGSKPVLCSDCFEKESPRESRSGQSAGISSEQFNQLNTKLDKIIAVLETLEVIEDEEELDEEESEE